MFIASVIHLNFDLLFTLLFVLFVFFSALISSSCIKTCANAFPDNKKLYSKIWILSILIHQFNKLIKRSPLTIIAESCSQIPFSERCSQTSFSEKRFLRTIFFVGIVYWIQTTKSWNNTIKNEESIWKCEVNNTNEKLWWIGKMKILIGKGSKRKGKGSCRIQTERWGEECKWKVEVNKETKWAD